MKLIKNLFNRLNKILKKLTNLQRILLSASMGFFIYVSYVQVERFVNDVEDVKEDVKEDVEDEVIEIGMFDNLLSNLGLKNEKLEKKERQTEARKDEYNMYLGSDKEERKARAIADEYKKY